MSDNKYLSIITNFGCHYSCPYCIVKNNNIDIPKTTVGGLNKLVENIRKYDCNWVSISGGGDPLYNTWFNSAWWGKLFNIIPREINLELHTSYLDPVDTLTVARFDRVVYHCHEPEDLFKIYRLQPMDEPYERNFDRQIVRAVFVVTEDFTKEKIDDIAAICKHHPQIDELSFRQMVDSNYQTTHYCEEYLKAGHQKDWWYIEQNDYNIYYAENEVKFKYEDFRLSSCEDFCAQRNECADKPDIEEYHETHLDALERDAKTGL